MAPWKMVSPPRFSSRSSSKACRGVGEGWGWGWGLWVGWGEGQRGMRTAPSTAQQGLVAPRPASRAQQGAGAPRCARRPAALPMHSQCASRRAPVRSSRTSKISGLQPGQGLECSGFRAGKWGRLGGSGRGWGRGSEPTSQAVQPGQAPALPLGTAKGRACGRLRGALPAPPGLVDGAHHRAPGADRVLHGTHHHGGGTGVQARGGLVPVWQGRVWEGAAQEGASWAGAGPGSGGHRGLN